VIEDNEFFAVGGGPDAIGDGGYAVAEEGLLGRNVDVFVCGLDAEVGAAGEGGEGCQHEGEWKAGAELERKIQVLPSCFGVHINLDAVRFSVTSRTDEECRRLW